MATETVAAVPEKARQVAFFFAEEPYTYSDVLTAGALLGERAEPGQPPARADEEIVRFRRSRHLEAASDLRGWLADRDLDGDDLLRYARGETVGWWPEAVFSGCFGHWVEVLERWLTVQHLLHAAPGRELARARDEYESWAGSAIQESEIEQLIGRRKIGWTWLEYDELIFESDSAVAEARACVAEDGERLEDVAARAGVPVTARSEWLEHLPPEVGSLLLALEAGQVGVAGGEPELVRLRHAQPPSVADDRVRRLALAELLRVRLTSAGAGLSRRVGAW